MIRLVALPGGGVRRGCPSRSNGVPSGGWFRRGIVGVAVAGVYAVALREHGRTRRAAVRMSPPAGCGGTLAGQPGQFSHAIRLDSVDVMMPGRMVLLLVAVGLCVVLVLSW